MIKFKFGPDVPGIDEYPGISPGHVAGKGHEIKFVNKKAFIENIGKSRE